MLGLVLGGSRVDAHAADRILACSAWCLAVAGSTLMPQTGSLAAPAQRRPSLAGRVTIAVRVIVVAGFTH